MPSPQDQLAETLKRHKYSVTKARQRVFAALLGQPPRNVRELAADCLPDIDRASLYRTIELFERLGIIHRLHIGWKYKLELSDNFQPHHHHAICSQCGSIITLPENDDIECGLSAMAATVGFAMQDHQLELRGRCANCQ